MKMRELLNNEKRWTKLAMARDEFGREVRPQSVEAVQFCLLGAAAKCYSSDWMLDRGQREAALLALRKALDNDIQGWNDAPGRNFGEVKALLEGLNI
jgi:hypothetical protein